MKTCMFQTFLHHYLLRHQPARCKMALVFRSITKTVQSTNGQNGDVQTRRTVLSDATGKVIPGEMLAGKLSLSLTHLISHVLIHSFIHTHLIQSWDHLDRVRALYCRS